jgi:hypothetical protein
MDFAVSLSRFTVLLAPTFDQLDYPKSLLIYPEHSPTNSQPGKAVVINTDYVGLLTPPSPRSATLWF